MTSDIQVLEKNILVEGAMGLRALSGLARLVGRDAVESVLDAVVYSSRASPDRCPLVE